MARHMQLYSFIDADHSGKVRWTACELGYEIEEFRLGFGGHTQPDYLTLNPYTQIPTAIVNGERLPARPAAVQSRIFDTLET